MQANNINTNSAILNSILKIQQSDPFDYELRLYDIVKDYKCDELFEVVSTLSIHLDRKIKNVNQEELGDYIYVLADFSKEISDHLNDLKKIGLYLQKNRDCRKELKILKKWISEANNFKVSMNNYANGLNGGEYSNRKFLKKFRTTVNRFRPTFNQIYKVFDTV